jgi:hypothetical protein
MLEQGIRITNLYIKEYTPINPKEEIGDFHGILNFNATLTVDDSTKRVSVLLLIKVDITDSTQNSTILLPIGSIETVTEFTFTNWDDHVSKQNDICKVNEALERQFIQIAFDSTRGLMRERGNADLIGRMILPPFDPRVLENSQIS